MGYNAVINERYVGNHLFGEMRDNGRKFQINKVFTSAMKC